MPTKALLQKKKKDQAKSDKSSSATLFRTSQRLELEDEPVRSGKENGRKRGSREETKGEEEAKKRRQFRTHMETSSSRGRLQARDVAASAIEKKRTINED
ncbi:hypothetical protein CDL15_Pgr011548 [Punica granatum]|uniref:Uncharacterized protein n=1 Tax=Punica granatum TaxID=22663 RepID=A0A218Y1E9_PUNGR|nr:hypothetical protein CDL15_Pgr011548 [Punica granatum]